MGGPVGTQHSPPCWDLREYGPSGPVKTYRLTPEELAELDRRIAEKEGRSMRWPWPPEEILRRMLAEGRDVWVARLLPHSTTAIRQQRQRLGVPVPEIRRAALDEMRAFEQRWKPVIDAWRAGKPVEECMALLEAGEGAGAPPAEAWGQQAEEQPQTGVDPAVLTTDQAEAEELAAAMQLQALAEAQDDDVADRPADLPLELVNVATTPQHLCPKCLKADVCPTPEVLAGYRPEVPELPTRLAGAVDLEVRVEVRSCRYYLPAQAAGGEAAD